MTDPGNLFEDAFRLLGSAVADVVPPDAQVHLLNAQRELLLAIAATVEHNRSRSNGRSRARGAGRPSRVELD